jgi:hypothetical protein
MLENTERAIENLSTHLSGLMSYLRYLYLFVHSGIQDLLCYVIVLFVFDLCTNSHIRQKSGSLSQKIYMNVSCVTFDFL